MTAARAAKLATSTCSGPIRYAPPPSRSTPSIRRMFDPTPSILAPSVIRNRQRSWMWGSQAAWPTIVSPLASTAAMIAFSVPITDASSRYMRLPDEALRAQVVGAVDLHLDAELREGVNVGVEAPAADHVAARRRDDGTPEARQQGAGEQERGANLAAEVGIELGLRDPGAVDPDLVRPGPDGVRAEVGEELDHHLDVTDAREVRQPHLLGGEHGRGEDRQRAVLVSGRADRAGERATTLDDERLHEAGAIVPVALDVTRDNAWETLTRYTKSESLLRHALAVEASTRWYARHFGEDEELWGCTALLHDFDYEIHPTLDKHPQDGAPILREEGYPEVLITAVLSHAEHLEIPRETPLQKTLFACDELSGFIHACGLVRPTGLEGLEPKSVRKKLKQPSFAAGVHRDEVYAGAELLGLELDQHIANVVAALQPIAGELGLPVAA